MSIKQALRDWGWGAFGVSVSNGECELRNTPWPGPWQRPCCTIPKEEEEELGTRLGLRVVTEKCLPW